MRVLHALQNRVSAWKFEAAEEVQKAERAHDHMVWAAENSTIEAQLAKDQEARLRRIEVFLVSNLTYVCTQLHLWAGTSDITATTSSCSPSSFDDDAWSK